MILFDLLDFRHCIYTHCCSSRAGNARKIFIHVKSKASLFKIIRNIFTRPGQSQIQSIVSLNLYNSRNIIQALKYKVIHLYELPPVHD